MHLQHPSSLLRHPEPIVGAFVHQPHDVFAATYHPLPFFLKDGKLLVGEVVAHFLLTGHAEGDELVSHPPLPEAEGLTHLVGIQAGDVLVLGDNETVRPFHFFHPQFGKGFLDTRLLYQQLLQMTQLAMPARAERVLSSLMYFSISEAIILVTGIPVQAETTLAMSSSPTSS